MKWVDIFQVDVGIFQTDRPSGHIYGTFQEYVRIANFYGFQMKMFGDMFGGCGAQSRSRSEEKNLPEPFSKKMNSFS